MQRHMEIMNRRHNCGFTLIEAMVALTVVSIGMLGIANLYTRALGAARTTQYRSQATNLLSDMADRIRGNRLGGPDYAGAAFDNACGLTGGNVCTPAQMAAHDLYSWGSQVESLLPSGAWEVTRNVATQPPTYTITVSWEEVGQGTLQAHTTIQVPMY